MGERKVRTSSKSSKPHTLVRQKMSSAVPGKSNLTSLFQSAPTAGNARIVRCSTAVLDRLRKLNEAEIITLFTPFVPHPPSTLLAKNMDPFEPLGRALPRQVRHVPYRLDNGMTETHADFMPASGAIITVICAPENVVQRNPKAFEQQLTFAREVMRKFEEKRLHATIPFVLILITDGAAQDAHEYAVKNFPAVVSIDEYTTAALANAVHALFGP